MPEDMQEQIDHMNQQVVEFCQQGQYEQAETLFQQVLTSQEKVLGLEHPDTLGTRHNLAALYRQQGQHERAEILFQQTLISQERVLKQEHPRTQSIQNNLDIL